VGILLQSQHRNPIPPWSPVCSLRDESASVLLAPGTRRVVLPLDLLPPVRLADRIPRRALDDVHLLLLLGKLDATGPAPTNDGPLHDGVEIRALLQLCVAQALLDVELWIVQRERHDVVVGALGVARLLLRLVRANVLVLEVLAGRRVWVLVVLDFVEGERRVVGVVGGEVARIRYSNALPPPPCPPKLLDIPNTGLSSGQYTSTGFASRLAREQPLNIEADAELGMSIDLVGIPGVFDNDESGRYRRGVTLANAD
jgi:hypothetical protein